MESARVETMNKSNRSALDSLIQHADSILAGLLDDVTVAAEAQSTTMYGYEVSELQDEDVEVIGNKIIGTLKYVTSGELAGYWGNGYFLALKFTDLDANATSVKVGLRPTYGGPGGTTPIDDDSGLVEITTDAEKNGAFMINDKNLQKVKVVSTDGTRSTIQEFDLSGLILEVAE